ncbi:cell division protein ZapE [Rheinheimera sp.]|uniref:cell division protein ZapE n=1 Tax=Rheinheimera sp. TaxID=1869214 RepID=UPI00307F9308
MIPSLSARYQQQVQQGLLRADAGQQQALAQLELRLQALIQHRPMQGLYLYGPVGRGKTLLMDWFYQAIPGERKNRLHFHHFMAAVHKALFKLQGQKNPLQQLAQDWAAQYQVLCFDEFFVTDIADAMLLGNLWQALFDAGVMLVATSNCAPQQLYQNGHRRERFEPFIDLLQKHCQILQLDAGQDYRRLGAALPQYYWLNTDTQTTLQRAAPYTGQLSAPTELLLNQRRLPCLGQNEQAIAFDFFSLCGEGRSQLDYMALASHYRLVLLCGVPAFRASVQATVTQGTEDGYQRDTVADQSAVLDNEARRFIALVDECYDRGCLLLISAEVPVEQLYQASQLQFAFARTISRLIEMQRWTPPPLSELSRRR